jgi:hypothetical protein
MTRTWAPSAGSIVVQHRRGLVKNSAGWSGFRLGKSRRGESARVDRRVHAEKEKRCRLKERNTILVILW